MTQPNMPRKLGRPRVYAARRHPTTVYLSDEHVERFRELGHGNMTQGVMQALTNSELWLAHVADPSNPAKPAPARVAIDDDPSREDGK